MGTAVVIIAVILFFKFVYVPYSERKEMDRRRKEFMQRAFWEEELKFMNNADRHRHGFPARKK